MNLKMAAILIALSVSAHGGIDHGSMMDHTMSTTTASQSTPSIKASSSAEFHDAIFSLSVFATLLIF